MTAKESTANRSRLQGPAGEARALEHLQALGLRLILRNYRVARGPGARAAEVDLIMAEPDGTVVFVEVRERAARSYGGAAASVDAAKRRRIVFAAQHWLLRQPRLPPCRFDVVAIDGGDLQWLKAAFDAGA